MLDFLPITGNSQPWLLQLFEKYVSRSKAIGKDGITQSKFRANIDTEIELIFKRIESKNYHFTRYREVLLSRGSGRLPRKISVPTIRDRLAIRATLEQLKHAFPHANSPPPHRFIKEIKTFLSAQSGSAHFLRMDIQDFYPSIEHSILLHILETAGFDSRFLNVIERAISTPTGSEQSRPTKGIPQGLAFSNILASIYMREFDTIADSEIFYRRYVDDILVIAGLSEIEDIHRALDAGLKRLALSSHPIGTVGKTEILNAADGVQYLGYELAIGRTSIRQDSLARMFNNLAKVLTSLRRGSNIKRHLFRLNLKITGCIINNARRGWLMFFSQTEDLKQLSFIDNWLAKEISNIPHAGGFEPKTFRKSYYEIRYNLSETRYVPNFDKYDLASKADVVCILSNRTPEQVEAMDVEALDAEFARLVGREITELERDIMQAFS